MDAITNMGKGREGKGDALSLIKYSSDRAVCRYPTCAQGAVIDCFVRSKILPNRVFRS